MRIIIFILSVVIANFSTTARADNVDKAVDIVQRLCVAKSGSLQVDVDASGELTIRKLLGSGVEASVNLSTTEVEGVLGKLDKLSASQATEMRECMKPYINKIIEKLIGGADAGEPRDIVIKGVGSAFKLTDFDRVMCAVVKVLYDRRYFSPRNQISVFAVENNLTNMNNLAVEYYVNIGLQNGYFRKIHVPLFEITAKGGEYITAKGIAADPTKGC